jgi:hypothetical protein
MCVQWVRKTVSVFMARLNHVAPRAVKRPECVDESGRTLGYPATHRRCTDGHRSGPGWADNAEQSAAARLLYPANVDLILALINWVEGVLNFTYVESIWECVENSLLFVPNQALYQAEPQPEME